MGMALEPGSYYTHYVVRGLAYGVAAATVRTEVSRLWLEMQ